jgi:enoyl-CoA hydratase/carnithine racemase
MTDSLLREDHAGLCTLTLNRPEKRNALDTALFERLEAELTALQGQTDLIGCVVLRGAGGSFCAGADLAAIGGPAPPPTFKPQVIERLAQLPQPVIAQIHGHCVTGGLELALAADMIVTGASAKFADTHGRWGLVGGWGMTQRLPRRIGFSQAKLMMMTARFVEAPEAVRIGLADVCVPDETLEAEVRALADAILANSWHTNFATKRLLRETDGMSQAAGLAHEHHRYPGFAPDYKERIASFGKK